MVMLRSMNVESAVDKVSDLVNAIVLDMFLVAMVNAQVLVLMYAEYVMVQVSKLG